ncbi:MAG: hypothetical protein U5K71_12570 [Gracilimonas sp.]|nr:hypothetical protein [Gracilimonas sp.]
MTPSVFDDPATLEQYRGEALALRAFAMHTMVRVYGYEPVSFGQGCWKETRMPVS